MNISGPVIPIVNWSFKLFGRSVRIRLQREIAHVFANFANYGETEVNLRLVTVTNVEEYFVNKHRWLSKRDNNFHEYFEHLVKAGIDEGYDKIRRPYEVKQLLSDAVYSKRYKEVLAILKECNPNYLQIDVIIPIIDELSLCGETQCVLLLRDICRFQYPEFFYKYLEFKHYLIQLEWAKGSYDSSIRSLFSLMNENSHMRILLLKMTQRLIFLTVFNKSEAVGKMFEKHIKAYVAQNNEIITLVILWSARFQSPWFSDQQSSQELLFGDTTLQKYVKPHIPLFAEKFLKQHQLDEVYRLMECLLKCGMLDAFSNVILPLFDYHYRRGDLRRCLAIRECCLDLGINLTKDQYMKCNQMLKIQSDLSIISKPSQLPFQF